MNGLRPHISASILSADFAALGDEVTRAAAAGVDSIHLDVMDGHFVDNISLGPVVVGALRPHTELPFHSHLMISRPVAFVDEFVEAGSQIVVAHVEADDAPAEFVGAVRATGRGAGLAINPETPADAVLPYLADLALVLVMTVHPGFGGQEFLRDALPKVERLRREIERRRLSVPIGIDGGVNEATIGDALAAGGDVLVCGSALYRHAGDLAPVVERLRSAALSGSAAKA
ncbi:MAG: ribulose-phosphate 3-epimerase [Chloroflexota bacterium]|nr:ribulose-phosphate 3-epimerase [Chloroflexota bacterium]